MSNLEIHGTAYSIIYIYGSRILMNLLFSMIRVFHSLETHNPEVSNFEGLTANEQI